ncbi:MAG TPA: YihY/virulence factor BrkB family protein [Candidatus Binatia bacterium]
MSLSELVRQTGALFRDAFSQWREHNAFQLAAALAYYTIFSFTPLLTIAIAIAALAFGREAAQNQIVTGLSDLVGEASAKTIQTTIHTASMEQKGGTAAIIGAVVLLLGAAGVVGQLQQSLNYIWGVKPKSGWKVLVRDRLFSFALVLAIGFLLLVSLVVTAVVTAVTSFFGEILPGGSYLWHLLDAVISLGFVTVLFGLIFKMLPDVALTWRDVIIGASITSLLFTIGKFLIGFYIGHATISSAYGAAGSLVTLLVWVYYSAIIFFYGAEITQVYTTRHGSRPPEAVNPAKRDPSAGTVVDEQPVRKTARL